MNRFLREKNPAYNFCFHLKNIEKKNRKKNFWKKKIDKLKKYKSKIFFFIIFVFDKLKKNHWQRCGARSAISDWLVTK